MRTSRDFIDTEILHRAYRRTRRRRIMWTATALLAIAGAVVAFWPAHDSYRASTVVEAGDLNGQGLPVATLQYDARTLLTTEGLERVKESILATDVLRVHITTTASTRDGAIERVHNAAEFVRRIAADTVGSRPGPRARAETTLDEASATLKDAKKKYATLNNDVAVWHATYVDDAAANVKAAQDVYDQAVKTGRTNAIATAKRDLDEAKRLNAQINDLVAQQTAAGNAVQSAQRKVDGAKFARNQIPSAAQNAVTVGDVQDEVISEGRSAARLSIAAIMFVIAIAAADALFLTRVKFAVPSDEPVRVPERVPTPQPVPMPVPEPPRPVTPNRRRNPRRRRERVAASPLDLPNIEVHLLDREGGLRAIRLRDAAGAEATNLQQPQES